MNLKYGGGRTAVFGLIVAAVVQWIVFLGLAELCSGMPSSGVLLILRIPSLSWLIEISITDNSCCRDNTTLRTLSLLDFPRALLLLLSV